jgi:uncharacterized membrane protein YkvA (DUF1232 family)
VHRGRDAIIARVSFVDSLKQRARRLKADVFALYAAARHPRTPWYAKLFIAAIVAYALSPIDLIPDFIPVLGLLDEVILLPFAIVLAVRMIPEGVMEECRARAAAERADRTRMGRIGAAIIIVVWVALIVLAGMWARNAFGALPHTLRPIAQGAG